MGQWKPKAEELDVRSAWERRVSGIEGHWAEEEAQGPLWDEEARKKYFEEWMKEVREAKMPEGWQWREEGLHRRDCHCTGVCVCESKGWGV